MDVQTHYDKYRVTKTYTPEQGLSATFRQWRAKSHCRFLHGYALGVRVVFECSAEALDENGWVYNFGGLKPFKEYITDLFDHKTLVAQDDPQLEVFKQLSLTDTSHGGHQLLQLVVVPRTGCEAFAKLCYLWLLAHLKQTAEGRPVRLVSVEVFEHGGNSATYVGA